MDENRNDYLGNLKFMGQDEDKNFYVQIEIVRSGPNRNGWDFQNMERLCKTFLGTPLLCAYLPNQIGDGHNFREKMLPTGEQILDFTGPNAERIVGAVSDNPDDIWTEEREDGVWAIAKGKIWRFYNRQLVDKLVLQGDMAVSAEIETSQGYTTEDGIEVYTEWEGLGVTLLNESVPPAVPGAHIQAIKAMNEQFKEMKFKAASYHPNDAGMQDPAEDTGETKPKDTSLNKGVRKHMSLNRREADRLAPLFEGYEIVGLSENSEQVVLMKDFGFFSYKFNRELGEEVVTSAITPVKNISVLCGSDEDAVNADLDAILRAMSAEVKESKSTIANLNAQLEQVNKDFASAKESIHTHRLEMVKSAINSAKCEIDECCDNADMEAECADMEARCEDYANMEKDGKFCGAEQARADLFKSFGEKQAKNLKAQKEQGKAKFAWNNGEKKHTDDGIASLLNRFNGR